MNAVKVADIMTKKVISLPYISTLNGVAAKMAEKNIGSVVIVKNEKPVGIITERDVVRLISKHDDFSKVLVKDVMTKLIKTISYDAELADAGDYMLERNIRRLIVVKGKKVIGIITETDLLKGALIEETYLKAEKKELTEDLEESEEKFKNIIEHSSDMFYVHDTHHVLSYVSPQSEEIFGYTPKEMMVNWITLASDNPINKEGIKITETAIKTGKKQEPYLLELIRKDKRKILVEIDESPLKDENGKVIGIMGALKDVTEKKKIEKALKKEKEFSDSILSTIPLGIDVVDENLNILFMNKTFLNIFGKKAIGKKCYEVYKDNKKQCEDCPLKSHVKVGETKTIITTGVAGKRIFEIAHTGMMFDDKKAIMEIFKDITDKRKSEQEKEKLANELQERVTELEKFKKLTVGRELRMIELKNKIKKLEQKRKIK